MANKAYRWNEKSIGWFKNAAECQSFHKELAEHIREELDYSMDICDMGCGLGYLSLELSKYVRSVTCIDTKREAVSFVNSRIYENSITNCRAYVDDFEQPMYGRGSYDAVVMSFFGHLQECYKTAELWTRGKLIAITNASPKRNFTTDSKASRCTSADSIESFFFENGIAYRMSYFTIPFGQPFKSIEEAHEFMRYYDEESSESKIDEYLQGHLESFKQAPYRYYLPNEKRIAMFVTTHSLSSN